MVLIDYFCLAIFCLTAAASQNFKNYAAAGTFHIFCLLPEHAEQFAKFSLAHFCLHSEDAEDFAKFSLAHFCLHPKDASTLPSSA